MDFAVTSVRSRYQPVGDPAFFARVEHPKVQPAIAFVLKHLDHVIAQKARNNGIVRTRPTSQIHPIPVYKPQIRCRVRLWRGLGADWLKNNSHLLDDRGFNRGRGSWLHNSLNARN
jgi:hypothetical protein